MSQQQTGVFRLRAGRTIVEYDNLGFSHSGFALSTGWRDCLLQIEH